MAMGRNPGTLWIPKIKPLKDKTPKAPCLFLSPKSYRPFGLDPRRLGDLPGRSLLRPPARASASSAPRLWPSRLQRPRWNKNPEVLGRTYENRCLGWIVQLFFWFWVLVVELGSCELCLFDFLFALWWFCCCFCDFVGVWLVLMNSRWLLWAYPNTQKHSSKFYSHATKNVQIGLSIALGMQELP